MLCSSTTHKFRVSCLKKRLKLTTKRTIYSWIETIMAEETEFIPPADIKASEYQTWKALKDIIRKLASAKKTEITK